LLYIRPGAAVLVGRIHDSMNVGHPVSTPESQMASRQSCQNCSLKEGKLSVRHECMKESQKDCFQAGWKFIFTVK
jgi:hypothetical protein